MLELYPIVLALLAPYTSQFMGFLHNSLRWFITTVFASQIYELSIAQSHNSYSHLLSKLSKNKLKESLQYLHIMSIQSPGYHIVSIGDKPFWVVFYVHDTVDQISQGRVITEYKPIIMYTSARNKDRLKAFILDKADKNSYNRLVYNGGSVAATRQIKYRQDAKLYYSEAVKDELQSIKTGDIILIHGPPGTGKSYIAHYLMITHKVKNMVIYTESWVAKNSFFNMEEATDSEMILFDEFEKEFGATINNGLTAAGLEGRAKMTDIIGLLDDTDLRKNRMIIFIANDLTDIQKNCPAFLRSGRITKTIFVDYPSVDLLVKFAKEQLGVKDCRDKITPEVRIFSDLEKAVN